MMCNERSIELVERLQVRGDEPFSGPYDEDRIRVQASERALK